MNKVAKIALIVGGIVLLLGALASGMESFGDTAVPQKATTVSAADMQKGTLYAFEDLIVVDGYATYGDIDGSSTDTLYAMAMFADVNGDYTVCSLIVDKDQALFNTIDAYINDMTADIGSLTLDIYAEYRSDINTGEIANYYDECWEGYREMLEEMCGKPVNKQNRHLAYLCDLDEDYEAYVTKANNENLTTAIVLGVGGIVLLLIGIFAKPKQNPQPPTDAMPPFSPMSQPHYSGVIENPAATDTAPSDATASTDQPV